MPLLRTAMYGKGVQLYCAPTADDRANWHSSMIHVALEGRCFLLPVPDAGRLPEQLSRYPGSRSIDSANAGCQRDRQSAGGRSLFRGGNPSGMTFTTHVARMALDCFFP